MTGAELRGVPLFKDLLPEEIEKFVKFTGATVRSYPRGERVLEAFDAILITAASILYDYL